MSPRLVRSSIAFACTLVLGASLGACGSKKTPPPPPAARAPAAASAAPSAIPSTLAKGPELNDGDFSESERTRDPFRPFLAQVVAQGPRPITNQRDVKLSNFGVEELRLTGIVLGGGQPRAMFVDPTGKGHFLTTGNFLCRPETVRAGSGGPEYQLNWRVDRIRDGEVVLLREDPAQPSIPAVTKVISLHPENPRGG